MYAKKFQKFPRLVDILDVSEDCRKHPDNLHLVFA